MSRHSRLSSELSGSIAKRLSHARNQLSVTGSFFNQFDTYNIYLGILWIKDINRNDPPFIFTFNLHPINYHFHFNIPGRARDIYIQARFACLRCAAGGHFVSA